MKKYFFSFLVIVIIFSGFFVFYFLNKSNNFLNNNLENLKIEKEIKWQVYTNNALGFSINIPEEVSGLYRCVSSINFKVPLKIFEDNENGIVFIAPEYYYKANWDSERNEFYGDCEKIIYTTNELRNETLSRDLSFPNLNLQIYKPFLGWAIIEKKAENEEKLKKVIQEIFGQMCDYRKEISDQENIYKIFVGENNNSEANLDNTTCHVNFSYQFLYDIVNKKIIFIKLGQECSFFDNEINKCYDIEILNSLFFNIK